jgi:hypothetical protein
MEEKLTREGPALKSNFIACTRRNKISKNWNTHPSLTGLHPFLPFKVLSFNVQISNTQKNKRNGFQINVLFLICQFCPHFNYEKTKPKIESFEKVLLRCRTKSSSKPCH